MNLHTLVANVVSVVNPTIQVTWMANTGYATEADFSRVPVYESSFVSAQVQALQFDDLKQIEGLGIQGLRRKAYLYGNVNGMVRTMSKGGDLLVFPDRSTWLVAYVLETYGHGLIGQRGWCSVVLTLQNVDPPPSPVPDMCRITQAADPRVTQDGYFRTVLPEPDPPLFARVTEDGGCRATEDGGYRVVFPPFYGTPRATQGSAPRVTQGGGTRVTFDPPAM